MSTPINKKILNSGISSVLIFLAFLIAINFLASQNPVYFDLTEEKIYTTSDASKDILKNLESEVNVNFYISKDLPQSVTSTKMQLVDLMNQYQDVTGSKLKVFYNEPENTPEKVQELAEIGIPQIQFNVIEKDKYEVRQGFFGVEITSEINGEIKREAIPVIQSIDSWEYDFISAVYSISRENEETVAFLKGHFERNIQLQDLQKSYKIVDVEIETEEENKGFFISDGKAEETSEIENEKEFVYPVTLIIIGPVEKISTEEIAIIDEFISNGGNVIVASESVAPDLQQNLSPIPIENNINELTEKYGIKINSDLIYDRSNSNITYQQGFFSVSKAYPFWVKALQDNFQEHPSLSGIQSVVFPWASSLSISDNEEYCVKSMISSTNQAKGMSDNYDLLPDSTFSFSGGSKKTIVAFAEPKDENSNKGTLFVIGDSDFISPEFLKQASNNETFFMNLVDSVSNSVNLASIRSKNIIDRPLKELEESEKNYWKFISIFGAAILINIYGILRITKRKKINK
ncbi:MAG: GldG family protein [Candidatus Pacebacteria bacterium]|nr:GldG family protein [Candidatus Paceibacterota bacterium]